MANKMTKKEKFELALTYVTDNEMLTEFFNHEIELLSKKRPSVNSKAKAESEARAQAVYSALSGMGEAVTVTELISLANNEVSEYTNQRVSALLNKLKNEGKVAKEVVKGKAYFSVA